MKIASLTGHFRNHPCPKMVDVAPFNRKGLGDVDVFVQNNIIEQRIALWHPQYEFILRSKKPFMVSEAPAFRKITFREGDLRSYHRWSWRSYFRDEGDYNNAGCPADRWHQIQRDLKIEIQDWAREDGGYILFIMQKPQDSSLKNFAYENGYFSMARYTKFIDAALSKIRGVTDRPIRVRLHPINERRMEQQVEIFKTLRATNIELSGNYHGVSGEQGGSGGDGLRDDLSGAFAVVGMNSNALVESVCEGKPTWALCPSAMAWDVCQHDLSTIEDTYTQFDRKQWLNDMGYTQWRTDEILAGEPIRHLLKNLRDVAAKYGWVVER